MATHQRKRNIKSIDLNNYLDEKNQKLVDAGIFSTPTDVIVTALIEFHARYDLEKDNFTAVKILLGMLQTPEGKEAFEKVTQKKKEIPNDTQVYERTIVID